MLRLWDVVTGRCAGRLEGHGCDGDAVVRTKSPPGTACTARGIPAPDPAPSRRTPADARRSHTCTVPSPSPVTANRPSGVTQTW